ncbi:SDR family oxidoreductase [Nesterenkonia sp. LB17]|uniref:SDR family oxidoreductase n=1 Tax=Nesterenkonia sp. LB17 TaxID=2901230 RepID=UPI001F4C9023|nr:SDR family oxidoreductase [Nesterenkonia sp. LB17]MCH8564309.1 SDR family oxidoreductase [Nesterenkonia sp. LB17]
MAATRVAVLGASGLAGSLVMRRLPSRGVETVGVSRHLGVDIGDLAALRRALVGAEVVVDCLNHQSFTARAAAGFFEPAARNVVAALEGTRARVVCLSIVNAGDPRVNRWLGHYRGKAAQERVYRGSGLPLSIVGTTQWFELAEQLLRQTRLAGTAFVPGLLSRPIAVAEAAEQLVEQALTQQPAEVTEVCGPEQVDMAELARAINEQDHVARRVVRIPLGGTALGSGALIPPSPTVITTTTAEQWLSQR